jgi:hypothetical protein
MAEMRKFETGATRNLDTDKLDFEGFLSPLVVEEFGRFMHRHRLQTDGQLRDSDNWQKGIPLAAYMKSMWRHFLNVWKYHRNLPIFNEKSEPVSFEEEACALLFNIMGYLHEFLKKKAGK